MLVVDNVSPMKTDVLVVDSSLLGFDMLIGMDIIKMLGGVSISQSSDAIFSRTELCACIVIRIEEPDFSAEFNEQTRAWTVSWKWLGNQPPDGLTNKVPEYLMSAQVWQEYRHELKLWLKNGWLLPYPEEELGPPKGLIPLMAIFQPNKSKVRPVSDFRELNKYIDVYTAHANICAQKIKKVEKEKLQRAGARSPKGVFTSACVRIFVAVPNSYPQRKEVLPIALGFWTQCSPIYHASNCWGYALERWHSLASNFSIHWQCLYQWRYSFRNQGEATFG